MLDMVYKTLLMDFVGVVSSGGVVLPTATVSEPGAYFYQQPQYNYNNGDLSTIRWHGFSVPFGTNQVILRFQMTNDYTVPVDISFALGIPDEYGLMSTIGETNTSNNADTITIQGPEFDLWTNTYILTGNESSPGTYSASGTVTFRIEFGNDGPARDNIILMSNYNSNSDNFISYTGDRNYGAFVT